MNLTCKYEYLTFHKIIEAFYRQSENKQNDIEMF